MSERMYIGTKIIAAKPMSANEFARSKLSPVAAQQVATGEVSLPEDKPGYQVRYEDGYISWSPKDVFERSYREITDAEKLLMASGKA